MYDIKMPTVLSILMSCLVTGNISVFLQPFKIFILDSFKKKNFSTFLCCIISIFWWFSFYFIFKNLCIIITFIFNKLIMIIILFLMSIYKIALTLMFFVNDFKLSFILNVRIWVHFFFIILPEVITLLVI